MAADRSRYGLLVSALGAILLAVAVFLPWYGVSLTPTGISFVQQLGDQFATQYGNASLQSYVGAFHGSLAGLAGQQLGAVSAHQVLKDSNVVLLVLAGLGAARRALSSGPRRELRCGGSGWRGGAARRSRLRLCPLPHDRAADPRWGDRCAVVAEGPWLALLGSMMMIVGGVWPRTFSLSSSSSEGGVDLWSGLSGWTPES